MDPVTAMRTEETYPPAADVTATGAAAGGSTAHPMAGARPPLAPAVAG